MTSTVRWTMRSVVALSLAALAGLVLAAPPAGAADELIGTFRLMPGACGGGGATGSYFRMILPTGTLDGPWVENADSACADRTYTLLSPGTDGGLVTGSHQPAPTPGFDDAGNSTATRIIRPVRFFGVAFSASTDPRDLQTGAAVPAPTLRVDGRSLSGDLRAFAATWNEQAFNQGAPKPDGSRPGNTAPARGSYDPATGAFSLTWTSTIVGGPFDKFTGLWHLEGTFVPAGGAAPADAGGAPTATVARGADAGASTPDAPVPNAQDPTAEQQPGPAEGQGADGADPATASGPGPELAVGATVADESFEAPTWLVVALAAVGIGGVVVLLVLGPRGRGGSGAEPPAPGAGAAAADHAAPASGPSRRRRPLQGVVAIGVGLALAPLAFQMFSRAPGGGEMLDDFAPYMVEGKIDAFRADLDTIDAAHLETEALLAADPTLVDRQPAVAAFADGWPAIDDDMGSMLATMRDNIDGYDGVAALPPFALFPWFFVAPGLALAGLGVWSLRADRERPARGRTIALAAVAVGLLAAPAVFQMFTRAPGGARMIDDFRPFMTSEKVTEIQGYFLTIGTAEGELRRSVLPELAEAGSTAPTAAIATLNEEWARISGEMAPMIGTMSDNVGRFAGVAALPPFWLFPWFFVLPGLLVLGLLRLAHRPPPTGEDPAMAVTPTRSRLIGFPDPVNEVSARLVATGVVLMAVATIAFDLRWATLVLAYGFLARVLTGPTLSPLGQLVTRVLTPRLPFEPKYVPGPPKRFAQGVGLAFTLTAAVLTFGFDQLGAAKVVLGILVVAASLEAFVGFCLGCKAFAILMRLGVIPQEVCERCADLWGIGGTGEPVKSTSPVAT